MMDEIPNRKFVYVTVITAMILVGLGFVSGIYSARFLQQENRILQDIKANETTTDGDIQEIYYPIHWNPDTDKGSISIFEITTTYNMSFYEYYWEYCNNHSAYAIEHYNGTESIIGAIPDDVNETNCFWIGYHIEAIGSNQWDWHSNLSVMVGYYAWMLFVTNPNITRFYDRITIKAPVRLTGAANGDVNVDWLNYYNVSMINTESSNYTRIEFECYDAFEIYVFGHFPLLIPPFGDTIPHPEIRVNASQLWYYNPYYLESFADINDWT